MNFELNKKIITIGGAAFILSDFPWGGLGNADSIFIYFIEIRALLLKKDYLFMWVSLRQILVRLIIILFII